ncbi:MFS transporter [Zavarzinella formosa]|uniref:MFS transporter n=1 Tax=Zavarzinella formosa TaxID=360055 RepID=UPI0002DC03A4|nr:MFS transporter [Zavarzinella formosa]
MSAIVTEPERSVPAVTTELPTLVSWVNLFAAGVIYVCTNPGRTHGLGVITEPLLKDFEISRATFGQINFWATMVVAALSFGFGTIVDRLGIRRSAWTLTALTAAATALMAIAGGYWTLFAAITLARLFGQGILALVSTGLLGKSFTPGRAPMAAAVYLLLTGALYGAVVQATRVGLIDLHMTWREIWLCTAAVMAFGALPVSMLLITEPKIAPPNRTAMSVSLGGDRTMWEAVRSPVFLVYGGYCMVNGISGSGIALFNESLLKDRGFGKEVFFDSLLIGIVSMIVFKFGIAWLCQKWSMGKMLALGMLMTAGALATVQHLETTNDVYLWSVVKALAMAIHVVVYFSIWVYAFGRRDLAQIQGAVHVITITASGVGPLVFGMYRDHFGTYIPLLNCFAWVILALGVLMLFVKVPCANQPVEPEEETE